MKRTAILLVLVALLAAGGFVFRDRLARLVTGSATSSGAAAAPTGATGGPMVPPAVPSPESLTKDVNAIEARMVTALRQSAGSGNATPQTQLDRMFEALKELHAQIPRDHFDPAAIVKAVGTDPVALARWVNDHTSLVPYRGTLRGAVGVLMDRYGNSLDRALLLDALLRAAGRETRLARAHVDGGALDSLVAAASRPLVTPSAATQGNESPQDAVKRAGIDPAPIAAEQTAWHNAARKLGDETGARAHSQAAALLAAVTPHVAPAADEMTLRREALADHWFVQFKNDADWVSLDAVPGRNTFEPLEASTDTMDANELPDDVQHRVRIRVVAEYWKDGALQPEIALDEAFAPAAVMGQAVSLHTLPDKWPDNATLRAAKDPKRAFLDAALAQRAWTPILQIGARPILSRAFTDDGRLIDPTSADEMTAALGRSVSDLTERTIGGATDLLGSLPSGDPAPARPAAPSTTPVLTAQWIEYEISAPGLPVETVRRDVFDLLSAEQRASEHPSRPNLTEDDKLRRALALINDVELLPVGVQLHPEYVTALRSSRLQAARTYITQAVAARNQELAPPASLEPMPGRLMDLAVARAAWSTAGNQLYFDRPNLFGRWRGLRLEADQQGRRVVSRESFDIMSNYLAFSGTDAAAGFRARLEQGVLDTNVEMVLASDCPACDVSKNAAQLFSASAERKEPWIVVAPGETLPAGVTLPADIRVRINKETAAGTIVAVGSAPDPSSRNIAWWSVDPKSGRALGIGSDGFGQSEHGMFLKAMVVNLFCAAAIFAGAIWGSTSGPAFIAGSLTCLIGFSAGVGALSYASVAGGAGTAAALEWAGIIIGGIGSIIGNVL